MTTRSFLISCLSLLTLIWSGCTSTNRSEPPASRGFEIFRLVDSGRIATDGSLSRGVAWGDYDGDGDPDLYVANSNGQWNALYRNEGDGAFKKITAASIVASETVIHGGNSQGVSWVDYDNDGKLDLYVVSRGDEAPWLFRNDGQGGFERIEDSSLTTVGISASVACWADFEGDGDLDVFLAGYGQPNRVFRNDGSGRFEEVEGLTLTSDTEGRARACACGDVNNDGLPEIYVANARLPNSYFINSGDWQFRRVDSGHVVEDVGYSYGVSWADYDDDGDQDLFVANFDKENVLYNNDGTGNLRQVEDDPLVTEQGGASKGHSWGDYDNDGDQDLYIANGTYGPEMANFLYLNDGSGHFERHRTDMLETHADTSAGAAHADFDRDGDLDVFVANWGSRDQVNRLYENITSEGNWLMVRLVGTESNGFGIGARVEVHYSDEQQSHAMYRWMYPVTGFASQNDMELHFGLGDATEIDSLVIHWPSGLRDVHTDVGVCLHLVASEGAETLAH